MTPRGEEDDDPLIVDGDALRMRWHELQRSHLRLPRRAHLTDLRADEDSSDEEAWDAAQRRVHAEWLDTEITDDMIESPESFIRVPSQPYVPFQLGTTSLDGDIVEEPDSSESRYVRMRRRLAADELEQSSHFRAVCFHRY